MQEFQDLKDLLVQSDSLLDDELERAQKDYDTLTVELDRLQLVAEEMGNRLATILEAKEIDWVHTAEENSKYIAVLLQEKKLDQTLQLAQETLARLLLEKNE